MSDLPPEPEAVTAAALVLADVEGDDQTCRQLADDVLRAAVPAIRAAERERIRALAAERNATVPAPCIADGKICGAPTGPGHSHVRPFADLIGPTP